MQPQSIPQDALERLSEKSRTCISNLINHFTSPDLEVAPNLSDSDDCPLKKIAAVLALLYEQDGEIRVLLTTRSEHLRTHAGQTALPGGKWDPSDVDLTTTAFREANEEVGLPISNPYIHVLGLLPPLISLHRILVTPVVAFLSQPSLLRSLKPAEDEVSRIFSHPLEAILDPHLAKRCPLVPMGSKDWPYETEVYNTSDSVVPMLGNTTYRMHRFRSSGSPIKGLTAEILMSIAEIGFARPPSFEHYAPDQLRNIVDVIKAVAKYEASIAQAAAQ